MPFPLPDPQGYCWAAFQEIVAADQVTGLINAYLALDVVFAVVIGALLYRALRTACRIECAPRPGWLPFLATPNTRLAFYVVAADICENLLFFVIVALSAGGGAAATWMLAALVAAACAKWLMQSCPASTVDRRWVCRRQWSGIPGRSERAAVGGCPRVQRV
ncbi:MAG: hypothetical protein WBG36_00960 [Ornithinimicrobium sp.]